MARQLVGISAILPYMFWDKIYSSCAQLRSCNVIMQSKRGRVEDKVLHFTHKPILKHINEHMFHLHLSFQTRQLKLPVLPVLQIFKNISQLNHRITFTLSLFFYKYKVNATMYTFFEYLENCLEFKVLLVSHIVEDRAFLI